MIAILRKRSKRRYKFRIPSSSNDNSRGKSFSLSPSAGCRLRSNAPIGVTELTLLIVRVAHKPQLPRYRTGAKSRDSRFTPRLSTFTRTWIQTCLCRMTDTDRTTAMPCQTSVRRTSRAALSLLNQLFVERWDVREPRKLHDISESIEI